MRKHIILTTAALTLALGLLTGCGGIQATAQDGSSQLSPLAAPGNQVLAGVAGTSNSTGDALTAEQAKQIALEDAGLSADAVTFLRAEPDYENGRNVFDVEFYQGNTEYDYEIDATTGEIRSVDRDIESYQPQAQTTQPQTGTTQTQTQSSQVSLEQARQIALSHAGLSADAVTYVKAGQEYDDGRLVYEFEFYQGATEYDYEIDAATGEIRSFDQDAEYYTPQAQTQQSAAGEISAAEAKAIAFSHAGVSEADARGLEMDIDRDHGRTIYEFEWAVGRIEYSCDVDAATGAVVGFERDAD